MILRIMLVVLMLVQSPLFALELELTQGVNGSLPIAVNSFGQDSLATTLSDVIRHDLAFSGQFRILGSANEKAPVDKLRLLGADSVVNGSVQSLGGKRYEVSFELVNAAARGQMMLSRVFQVHDTDMRALGHHISDMIYEQLTGVRGIFSTKIAYILVVRNGDKTRYSLEVADADGHNPRSLLVSSEPIMSPSWSPNGKQIAYVSFERKKAQIYTVSVETGYRRLISDFEGINGAPAWSPNGQEMTVVLSKSGVAKLYSVQLSSGQVKQLTFGGAIDTEPRYAPDGKSIVFTSGRGGAPQVYELNLADGKISRLSFQGNYNARASLTPDKKYLVMLHREDHNFNIGVQNIATSRVNTLTYSSMDESPSLSPNGKLILYATRHRDQGVLAVVSVDGRIRLRLPSRDGDVQEPAWSPYIG